MHLPKMIFFDYGDTLLIESPFDGAAGTEAVLRSCVENPKGVSVADIQNLARELDIDLGRGKSEYQIELHNHIFQRYLYECLGISPLVSPQQLEQVFWSHAAPATPAPHIHQVLDCLNARGIRSGVISNISFSGESLKQRMDSLLPNNRFEFIIASSDYAFRKPHRRIFEVALSKAGLSPNDVWHCGDHPLCDVEGSAKLGITPIWYSPNPSPPSPVPNCAYTRISDWLDLIHILAACEV